MNIYQQLRLEAKAKRDRGIRAVRAEYNRDLCDISKLATKILGSPRKRRHSTRALRTSGKTAFSELHISEAVAFLLKDSAMTLTELTIEIQNRGIRPADDPRKVQHAIRAAMLYHRTKYKRDKTGRWSLLS